MQLLLEPPKSALVAADKKGLFAMVERKPNLAADVISQIESAIIRGELEPGDKLPPERELTDRFGVSRTVVREAIHALSAKHLIEVQPGAGAVVAQPSTQSIAGSIRLLLNLGRPNIELHELVEVRINLEAEIATLCAERRSQADLEALAATLEGMRVAGDASTFTYHDMRFHLLLAEATHNRLYVILLHALLEIVTNLSLIGSKTVERRRLATAFHERIYKCISDNDSEGARSAMLDHLGAFGETARGYGGGE